MSDVRCWQGLSGGGRTGPSFLAPVLICQRSSASQGRFLSRCPGPEPEEPQVTNPPKELCEQTPGLLLEDTAGAAGAQARPERLLCHMLPRPTPSGESLRPAP